MGLKSAVIVVGGWGGPFNFGIAGGKFEGGTWTDGGVASGSVVNRMPVDTVVIECVGKR